MKELQDGLQKESNKRGGPLNAEQKAQISRLKKLAGAPVGDDADDDGACPLICMDTQIMESSPRDRNITSGQSCRFFLHNFSSRYLLETFRIRFQQLHQFSSI